LPHRRSRVGQGRHALAAVYDCVVAGHTVVLPSSLAFNLIGDIFLALVAGVEYSNHIMDFIVTLVLDMFPF
jgi:hypothetical protein